MNSGPGCFRKKQINFHGSGSREIEMDSGPSGHHVDQSPVIFQSYSGPSSVRGVSRPQGVEVSYGPGGNHMDQGPVIFSKFIWTVISAECLKASRN